MRFTFVMILFFLCSFPSKSQTLTAITHVNIVDVKNEKIISDQTIILKNDKIEMIGSNLKLPPYIKVIQGKDKFLIPGLWDMHYHNMDDESAEVTDSTITPLLIANGITGVRDMFALKNTLKRRDSIREGRLTAPETFAGAMVDGPKPIWPLAISVKDTVRAVILVDSLKNAGYDFIKVYSALPREVYFAIATESKKQNIPFEGHVPSSITPLEAAVAGQKSQEHQIGMIIQCSSLDDSTKNEYRKMEMKLFFGRGKEADDRSTVLLNSFDRKQINNIANVFLQSGTWYCPTIITNQNYFIKLKNFSEEIKSDSLIQYVSKSSKSAWGFMGRMFVGYSADDWKVRMEQLALLNKIVKILYDKKVNMLAGDDNNNPFCIAGFGVHQELKLLVDCGIPDAEVLKIATYNPAVFFKIEDKFGTIEQGKFANLVLLDANPLTKIGNTEKINAVFLRGHYFDKNALNNLLYGVKEYCERPSRLKSL
jgi:Amidohydrolase family